MQESSTLNCTALHFFGIKLHHIFHSSVLCTLYSVLCSNPHSQSVASRLRVQQERCNVTTIYWNSSSLKWTICSSNHILNKELFENTPPYIVFRPTLKGGIYISSCQTSKIIFKLYYIHVQTFTSSHKSYGKSLSYSIASFHKSIHMNMVTNLNDISDKYTQRL